LKLDGYRLEVVKAAGAVTLYSRSQKVLNGSFGHVAEALKYLSDNTALDGELVALAEDCKPNFNLLHNFRSSQTNVTYYAFDFLAHKRRNLNTGRP